MRNRLDPRMGLRAVGLGVFLVLTTASTALAQYYNTKGAAELTLYGGAYFGGDIYTGNYVGLSRDVNVDDDWAYGGRLAYVFSRSVGLEAGYGRSVSGIQLGAGGGQPPSSLGELTENRYELNFNFYTNPGPVQGYFTLGGGATNFSVAFNDGVNPPAEASDTRFTSNIGFGVKMATSPKVALRFDGRWRYTDTNVGSDTYYCDWYGYCYSYDSSYYGSGEVTGGLTYTLGGK